MKVLSLREPWVSAVRDGHLDFVGLRYRPGRRAGGRPVALRTQPVRPLEADLALYSRLGYLWEPWTALGSVLLVCSFGVVVRTHLAGERARLVAPPGGFVAYVRGVRPLAMPHRTSARDVTYLELGLGEPR